MPATTNRAAQFLLEPYFDSVRDVFVSWRPGELGRLTQVKLVVDSSVRDTPRHFAGCRDDGKLIAVAPELVDLPAERVVAILAHEFGHAADFSYPGSFWVEQQGEPARWDPPEGKGAARQLRRWRERSAHEIEITADAVVRLVTGAVIRYSGPCMLQTFSRGVDRPVSLR